jgi:hypothetical protein
MSTTVTNDNPTGITNYNIHKFALLPEWQQLAQALNNVALAANAAKIGTGGQDELVEAVGHLARGVGFMDCCPECERFADINDIDTFVDTIAAPYATTVEDGWLRGRYRCANGHEWTCGYALNIHLWFG